MTNFMFSTGIENSCPTIALPDGSIKRVDEFEKCGHYARWRDDFRLVKELGISHLRYGPPYYRCHVGPGRYDWEFADQTIPALRDLGIVPIMDLCHFGVPDWVGGFQNAEWPAHFAEYAKAFAKRYPHVRYYTPVNEMGGADFERARQRALSTFTSLLSGTADPRRAPLLERVFALGSLPVKLSVVKALAVADTARAAIKAHELAALCSADVGRELTRLGDSLARAAHV